MFYLNMHSILLTTLGVFSVATCAWCTEMEVKGVSTHVSIRPKKSYNMLSTWIFYLSYLFSNALQHKCCRSIGLLVPFWKLEKGEKFHDCMDLYIGSLKPSAIQFMLECAYRDCTSMIALSHHKYEVLPVKQSKYAYLYWFYQYIASREH